MSAQQSLFKSGTSITNIQRSLNSFGTGLRKANNTSTVIIRGLVKSNRAKEKAIRSRLGVFEKRREAVRRREREDLIESAKINSLGVGSATQRVITGSTKGILGRVMDFVGTIFVGWLITNLPKIIKGAQDLITKMTVVYNVLRGWVDNTINFFRNFNVSLDGLRGRIFGPQQDDVDEEEKRFKSEQSNAEDGVNNMVLDLEKGIEALKNFNLLETLRGMFKFDDDKETGTTAGTTGGSATAGQYKPILDLIGSAEGGYTSIAPNDKNDELTSMTIAEAANATGEQGGRGAIGRYQLTNPIEQAKAAGLNPETDLFSPENQDKIAISLIEGRGVTPDMITNDPNEAASRLAKEFAGIPVLASEKGYVQSVERGQSYYEGFSGNRATITPEQVEEAFEKFKRSGGQLDLSKRFAKDDDVSALGAPAKITSIKGALENFRTKPHGGLDIACAAGLYIALRVDCEVVGTKDDSGYGRVIDVWVPSVGVQLRFAHNSSIIIKSGGIPAGTSFAVTGSTGKSTGPHIHLEASTEKGSTNYGGNTSPDPYVGLIMLSAAQIDRKPGQIPDLSGRGGPSLEGRGMSDIGSTVASSKKKGSVIPVPIPMGGQQSQSPTIVMSGGTGGGGGTKTVVINELNSFITNNLLRELEYT
jgi:murein DD-endopeptidase MepM/ murein hydrolase activator NlpD